MTTKKLKSMACLKLDKLNSNVLFTICLFEPMGAIYIPMLNKLKIFKVTYTDQYMMKKLLDKKCGLPLSSKFHTILFDTLYKEQNLPEEVFNNIIERLTQGRECWNIIKYCLRKSPRYANVNLAECETH